MYSSIYYTVRETNQKLKKRVTMQVTKNEYKKCSNNKLIKIT